MKVYIVEAHFYDFECSWFEIVKVFKNKDDADLFALQCEDDCLKCTQQLKEFDDETYKLLSLPKMKMEMYKYQEILKDRNKLKNKLKSEWADKDRYWHEGGEIPSFEVNEFDVAG